MAVTSPTQAVRVRAATAADAPFVMGLVPAFVDFGLPAGRDPDEIASAFARDLQQALDGRAAVFVAEDDGGTPLGFIHLQTLPDLTGRPRAHVGDVAVAPAAQGRGVGRKLMAFAESWAREHGHDRIGLAAFTTNERAIRFYEQLGYAPQLVAMTKALP